MPLILPRQAAQRLNVSKLRARRLRNAATNWHPLIQSVQANRSHVSNAFLQMISAAKKQVVLKDLAVALMNKDWASTLKILNVEERLKQVAIGHGLAPGVPNLRDALRKTFNDGAQVGLQRLHKIPVRVKKANVAAEMSFDAINQSAIDFLNSYTMDLITNVSQTTQAAIHNVILRAFQEGGHPYTMAREIRDMIGLTPQLSTALDNYTQSLIDGNYASALKYQLGDGRFDSTLERLDEEGGLLSGNQIENMAGRYAERALNYRANTIARTETANVSAEGQRSAWSQAMQQGFLNKDETLQRIALGPNPCQECQQIADDNADGVPIDEGFDISGANVDDDYPAFHPNCTCAPVLIIVSSSGEETEEEE